MLAAPMARLQQKKQAAVTTGLAGTIGIACAMGLRLIRDLPGVPGFLAQAGVRSAVYFSKDIRCTACRNQLLPDYVSLLGSRLPERQHHAFHASVSSSQSNMRAKASLLAPTWQCGPAPSADVKRTCVLRQDVVDMLLAPLYTRTLFGMRTDEAFANRLVKRLLGERH